MEPFADSSEHLLAELERIDLLMRSRVAHLRRVQTEDEHFRGLYISEQEVDALLARPLGAPQWLKAVEEGRLVDIDATLLDIEQMLESRRRLSLAQGIDLRLARLANLFGLDRFDTDVLLVALAVEIDLRYEKLYAYLQDDVTKKRPSVDLAIQLLTASSVDRLEARRRFLPSAPLFAQQIVQLRDDPSQPDPPLLARYLKVEDRIVQFLFGIDEIDGRLRAFAEPVVPRRSLDDLLLTDDARRALRRAWPALSEAPLPVMLLAGPAGAGKRSAAEGICHERQWPLLVVDVAALPAESDEVRLAALIEREAALLGGAVYWRGGASLGSAEGAGAVAEGAESAGRQRSALAGLLRAIDAGRAPCFWAGEDTVAIGAALARRAVVVMRVAEATHPQRASLWSSELAGAALDSGVDLAALASRFKLRLGGIVDAAATARRLARLRDGERASITMRDLQDACRMHSNQKLSSLARKTTPRQRWDDLVLPADRLAQLREICNHVKYRDRVYGDWGFGRKLALGKGLAVLFAGPSGTGKTMSASIIAAELGLDLYRIDLSTVISKYIGETEKNLSKIFDEAETSNAILFFDEADALFGKRSEVRDSHDRYANIEVGYLLQRMEEYEGIAILATNFRKNMDDAFVRRLHFTVEFPFPDDEDRHRIWKGIWPEDTPRDSELDLELLAQRFEMTGGNIKNVAVAAAFLAADEDQVVRMDHVIQATQREYQKTGKLLGDFDEFGRGDGRARR
ncbi:ATP-binding protein [Variovorax sp. J22R115]|uniref:AAA family ATPase n=1 Tax=Variovorax sp. J22R115 TaxID=3053509 RepID=UPI002578055C|nr:ATP-binding protein [Variovorax sp. J22R115]MDM0047923.1 ATP-binding protein [Variovorax sp. J22R115]